jgi:hypothetical protein
MACPPRFKRAGDAETASSRRPVKQPSAMDFNNFGNLEIPDLRIF